MLTFKKREDCHNKIDGNRNFFLTLLYSQCLNTPVRSNNGNAENKTVKRQMKRVSSLFTSYLIIVKTIRL